MGGPVRSVHAEHVSTDRTIEGASGWRRRKQRSEGWGVRRQSAAAAVRGACSVDHRRAAGGSGNRAGLCRSVCRSESGRLMPAKDESNAEHALWSAKGITHHKSDCRSFLCDTLERNVYVCCWFGLTR